MMESKGLRLCGEIFRAGDYQHYLCSLVLPPGLGKLQWYLGALNVETARIKLVSKNPTIQLSRLHFWKSALFSVFCYLVIFLLLGRQSGESRCIRIARLY